jgi:hypothetical protein
MNPAVLLADALDQPRHVPVGQSADKIDPRSHERFRNQIATGLHTSSLRSLAGTPIELDHSCVPIS